MYSFTKFSAPKIFSLILGLLVVPLPAAPAPVLSQTRAVNATIDTTKTGAPISKNIYGQFLGGGPNSYKTVPAYAWAFHEMFRHSDVFQLGALTFATATMSSNRTEAILNPTGMPFKMYRDHFGTIPVEVTGDSPQPKPTFPAGGDQPAVNPGSDTYPLDASAAFSEDRKTLAIAVLNPSDSERSIRVAIHGAKLASSGHLYRMAPDSIDAKVEADKKPEIQVEEQTLDALPDTITVRPFSVNIYSYPVE